MIVLGALLATVLIAAASSVRTSEAILLRGSELGHLALFFIVASALIVVVVPGEVIGWALTALLLLAMALAARGRWFLIHATQKHALERITEAFTRIRVTFVPAPDRVSVVLPTRTVRLLLSPTRAGTCSLLFDGDWQENRLTLARSLLAKRFRTVLPELTIRIGGA